MLSWVGDAITSTHYETFQITVPGVVFTPATQGVGGVQELTNTWNWTWVYDGTNLPEHLHHLHRLGAVGARCRPFSSPSTLATSSRCRGRCPRRAKDLRKRLLKEMGAITKPIVADLRKSVQSVEMVEGSNRGGRNLARAEFSVRRQEAAGR